MPHTVNGIGTWYYGKHNLTVHEGNCEQCGTYTKLSTYDTTLFIVVVYIPVIPLRRYRVLNDCQACRRHYAIPLNEWNRRRDEEIGQHAAELESNPYDSDKALALARACAGYRDSESFLEHAEAIEAAVTQDPNGLAYVASAYELFSELQKAERLYRKALDLRPDASVRSMLGVLLIRQGRPAEAREYLSHLLSPIHARSVGTLYWLVEAYQAQGQHSEAQQVLNEMLGAFPDLATDKLFLKYRKRVSKRLGSHKPLASDLLKGRPAASSGTGWSPATFVAMAVLTAMVLTGGYFLFQKTRRQDVYFVNGLDHPYSVRVGDDSYTIPPSTQVEVRLPRIEGLIVEASEEMGWSENVEVRLATSFWSSLFDDQTYVVNPDRQAVLAWEQTEYAVQPVEKEYPYRIHLGRGFYTFEGVDYLFQEFPAEIELPSGASAVKRARLYQLTGFHPIQAYSAALPFVGPDDGLAYLIRSLRAHPEDTMILGAVASLMPADAFEEIAKPELDKRPLRMEWHRTYQSALEAAGREEELVERYRELLTAEPENTDLRYLFARVLSDHDESERLLESAAHDAHPSAYALHGLAYQRLVEARFDEALRLSRAALEIDPENSLFHYSEGQALLALHHFDELIAQMESSAVSPMELGLASHLVLLRVAAGDPSGAKKFADEYVSALENADESTRPYLDSSFQLGAGNWDAFLASSASLPDTRSKYEHDLVAGNYAAAIDELSASKEDTAADHLLIYLAAVRARDSETAKAQLAVAVEKLSQGTADQRELARCLAGDASPRSALRLAVNPEDKSVALAVLAQKTGDPSVRRLARALNYQLTFQRYYLSQLGF